MENGLNELIRIKETVESLKPFNGKGGIVTSLKKKVDIASKYTLTPQVLALYIKEAKNQLAEAERLYNEKYVKA